MTKKFVWIGFFVGSTLGNMLPLLWGGVGGIAGICLGYRWGQFLYTHARSSCSRQLHYTN